MPLARIVDEFQNGAAPEAIRLDYQTLNLGQVYGAITFYLANKEEVEQGMAVRGDREARVRSAWIFLWDESAPRLTSCFVL